MGFSCLRGGQRGLRLRLGGFRVGVRRFKLRQRLTLRDPVRAQRLRVGAQLGALGGETLRQRLGCGLAAGRFVALALRLVAPLARLAQLRLGLRMRSAGALQIRFEVGLGLAVGRGEAELRLQVGGLAAQPLAAAIIEFRCVPQIVEAGLRRALIAFRGFSRFSRLLNGAFGGGERLSGGGAFAFCAALLCFRRLRGGAALLFLIRQLRRRRAVPGAQRGAELGLHFEAASFAARLPFERSQTRLEFVAQDPRALQVLLRTLALAARLDHLAAVAADIGHLFD